MRTKSLVALIAVLTAASAPGQGKLNFSPVPVTNGLTGTLVGTGFMGGLYYGAPGAGENSLVLVTTVPLVNGFANFGAGVNSPGWLGGATLELQVRAWDAAYPTYDAAIASGLPTVLAGESVLLQAVTGGPLPPVPDPVSFPGFTIFPVPEPSTAALAAVGIALAFRRRKRNSQ